MKVVQNEKSKKARIIWRSVLAAILVVAVGANLALMHFSEVISVYFTSLNTTSKEAVAAQKDSRALAMNITDEGIVLLQNKDGMLPLKTSDSNKRKINVFGWSATYPVYGGSGSGSTDWSKAVTPKEGLESAGFEVNEELYNDYVAFSKTRPNVDMEGQDWTIQEPEPKQFYTTDRMKKATEFSDTAIVFIARAGGEGADLSTSMDGKDTYKPTGGMFGGPVGQKFGYSDDRDAAKHYLELSNREKGMIDAVTSNFSNVILIVNSNNAFELGWVKNYSQIKSVVNIAGAGRDGFISLGKVISGSVNPSGRTVDLYAADLLDAPAVCNFGDLSYVVKNADGSYSPAADAKKVNLKYVDYAEGVYVGYRYYETAAADGVINYDEKVIYPFGYGLSYTSFTQEVVPNSLIWNDKDVTVKVRVTNTGTVEGKDVVQLYYSAPYTGKLEKSSVALGAFSKTGTIKPGESGTVSLSFKVEDMASYDAKKVYSSKGAYVQEQGEYKLLLMKNSHEKIADVGSKVLPQVIFDTKGRDSDKQTAVNQLDRYETGEGSLTTSLSRANGFANLKEINQNMVYDITVDGASQSVKGKVVDKKFVGYINDIRYTVPADAKTAPPTTGAKNGKTLKNYVGVDYNDESWNELLDQLSVDDMVNLVAHGGYKTAKVKSVGKPATQDCDGPNGFTVYIAQSILSGYGFPSETLLASAWNTQLAEKMGECLGAEAKAYNIVGWYAPAMNIHRTAFGGRNNEYYSEDSLLSGKMAAATTKGYQSTGGYVYMKHFALNEQETNRNNGVQTWADEQTIREIYLKPFEMAVKEGGAKAVMSSFNSIGSTWAGACPGLLNEILRNEWGFRGMVITDYYLNGKGMELYPYMNFELGVRNGNDIYLTGSAPVGVPDVNTDSNDTLWSLREASHNILYTVANSNGINGNLSLDIPKWAAATIAVDVLLALLIAFGFLLTFRRKKGEQQQSSN